MRLHFPGLALLGLALMLCLPDQASAQILGGGRQSGGVNIALGGGGLAGAGFGRGFIGGGPAFFPARGFGGGFGYRAPVVRFPSRGIGVIVPRAAYFPRAFAPRVYAQAAFAPVYQQRVFAAPVVYQQQAIVQQVPVYQQQVFRAPVYQAPCASAAPVYSAPSCGVGASFNAGFAYDPCALPGQQTFRSPYGY